MTDYEREDMELAAVMGGRFHDKTQENGAEPAAMPEHKPEPVRLVKKPHAMDIPVESQWQPEKPAPDMMAKLKMVVKDVFIYAAVSLVLFWWKQTGRLEETTAWYAMLVGVGMVFFSVGKHCKGGGK